MPLPPFAKAPPQPQPPGVGAEEMEVEETENGQPPALLGPLPPADGPLVPDGAQEVMDEDEDGSARSEATFRFTVENVSRLREQVLSPPTFVRNLPWRIMVMPRADMGITRNTSLGFFLQCNGEAESSSWNCSAVATLKLIAQKPGCETFSRKISHIFHSKENDWGYSNFVDWQTLLDPGKGYMRNDTIILEVDVKADAPHGVAWDSKKHTGYVGLKNQGATCYMNSLLQTMFFTNQLRKAVYKMPTESDDSTKSVALALQRVFYELQSSDKPVGTKKLTRSFGWETLDSFMQHDVQEFLRVLLDKLESKMKGTCVEGTVPKLFEGKMISFIKCKHIQYESSRSETYYDIQLNIKGKKNIYDSFKDYIETEVLEGENKYDAGTHGLQEAEKGVIFTSFPPVLHLHLMRFQYDPLTDCSVKSNDRFEFYDKIDLRDYIKLSPQADGKIVETGPIWYILHAVLVHSGDNHGGHYVVFINPKGDGRWCKFDDDVVSRCTKNEAINHNYGGQEMDDIHPGVKQSTNAYMLVYIRDTDMSTVLQDVAEDDIPKELLERLKEEKSIELQKRKERSEAHLYMQFMVMTEDAFVGYQGLDLYDTDKMTPAAVANTRNFKVLKKWKPSQLMDLMAESFGIEKKKLRLWPFTMRTNKAVRPGYLDLTPEIKCLEDGQHFNSQLPFFLEIADIEAEAVTPFDKDNDVILFFKMYDPTTETLHYVGHWCVSILISFNDVANECRRRAKFPADTPLTLYEEIHLGSVERIVDLSISLDQGLDELMDGDIIVFHRSFEPGRKYKSLADFYTYVQFKYDITFMDKSNPADQFTLELSLKSSYMEMATKVGQRLGVDPLHIQFFKSQPYKDTPTYAVKFEPDGVTELLSLFQPTHKPARTPCKLFYQVLGIPVTELEHKKQFKILFYSPRAEEQGEREMILYVNKQPKITIRDVLQELSRVVSAERAAAASAELGIGGNPVTGPAANTARHQPLRLTEISSHKIANIVEEDVSSEILNQGSTTRYYRAEEILPEELDVAQDETLVQVVHFHKDARQTFGTPFLMKIRYGETWSTVKQRIQRRLHISEKDWPKMRIALVQSGTPKFIEKEDDDTPLKPENFSNYSGTINGRPWIGIEHANKAPKRSRYSTLEKAIKIYN